MFGRDDEVGQDKFEKEGWAQMEVPTRLYADSNTSEHHKNEPSRTRILSRGKFSKTCRIPFVPCSH